MDGNYQLEQDWQIRHTQLTITLVPRLSPQKNRGGGGEEPGDEAS